MIGYIVTKTIDKRFVYYYGKNGRWEGLKNNGIVYGGLFATQREIEVLSGYFPNEKFSYISVERN